MILLYFRIMTLLRYFSTFSPKISSCVAQTQLKHLRICSVQLNLYHTKVFKHRKLLNLFANNFAKLHFSSSLLVKSFQEKENEIAHDILEAISVYSESITKQPSLLNIQEYSDCPKELSEFAKITMHCVSKKINIEEKKFTLLINELSHSLPNLSDEDLLKCFILLCCLPPSPKSWSPNFKTIWNSLDHECVRRLPTWTTGFKLLVADYWFHLRLNRISQYNRSMVTNLVPILNELSDAEVVQLMFYINLQRELPPNYLRTLETRLLPVIKSLSIDELGVVCMGFFKTQNKMHDISIVNVIMKKFTEDIDVAKQVTLVAILKFFRKSMNLSYTDMYIPLLHRCTSYINKWDVLTCTHLALLSAECHVYHPLLLNTIISRVSFIIEEARLKDCMKLVQCLSHFNHPPSQEFNDLLISKIKCDSSQAEIESQSRILIYIALFYSYVNYYNHELLNIVLNTKFAKTCISQFPETTMTFAEVDCCVEIECTDYLGNRLGNSWWQPLEDRRGNFNLDSKNPNTFARLLREVYQYLEELLESKENIFVRHILPHMFSPDILVQLSGNPKSISLNGSHLFIPPKNEVWACFVIGVPFSFAFKSKQKTGVTAMKIRQLEKLGYKTVFIPYYNMPRDSEKRRNYIRQELNTVRSHCSDFEFLMKIK